MIINLRSLYPQVIESCATMNRIRGIVGDFSGTFIDRHNQLPYIAFKKMFPQVKDEILLKSMGTSKYQHLQGIMKETHSKESIEEMYKKYLTIQKEVIWKNTEKVQFLPGIYDVLQYLDSEGYKIGVTTGFPRQISHEVEKYLKYKYNYKFAKVVSTDDEVASRPDPEGCRNIMNSFGFTSHEMLKIGDTIYDVMEGKNANFTTVAIHNFFDEADYNILHIYSLLHVLDEIHHNTI